MWITLRTYGQDYIRAFIRNHISLASFFLEKMASDTRFEITGQSLGLAFFRLKADCSVTTKLVEKINERKNIYMIPAIFRDKIIIRFVICGMDPQEKDIDFAWNEVRTVADELFAEMDAEKIQHTEKTITHDKINEITENVINLSLNVDEKKQ